MMANYNKDDTDGMLILDGLDPIEPNNGTG